jgi:hypothetical protein
MGRLKVNKLTGHKLLQYLERKRTLRHNSNLIINNLPHEIYLLIFKYCLDHDIYLSFARVCKKWREVLKSSRSIYFMKQKFLQSWDRKCYCEPEIENLVPSTFSEYVSILSTYLTSKHNLLITPKNSIVDSKIYCANCSKKENRFYVYGGNRTFITPFLNLSAVSSNLCSEICLYTNYETHNVEEIKSITGSDIWRGFYQIDETMHRVCGSRIFVENILSKQKSKLKKLCLQQKKLCLQQKELCKRKKLAKRRRQRSPNWKKQKIQRPKFRKNGGRFKKNYR